MNLLAWAYLVISFVGILLVAGLIADYLERRNDTR